MSHKSTDIILFVHGQDPDKNPAGLMLTNGYLKTQDITKFALSGENEKADGIETLHDLNNLVQYGYYSSVRDMTLIRIYCGRGQNSPIPAITMHLQRAVQDSQGSFRIYMVGQSQGGHNIAEIARLLENGQILGRKLTPEYVGLCDPAFDSICRGNPDCSDMQIPGKHIDLYYQDISEMISGVFPGDECHGPMKPQPELFQINVATDYTVEGFANLFIDYRSNMLKFLIEYNAIGGFGINSISLDYRGFRQKNTTYAIGHHALVDPPHIKACEIGARLSFRKIISLIQISLN